jgi:hypothetical protein
MSLVVHVKPVVDRVILQVGHVAGDIDGSHSVTSLGRADGPRHTGVYAHIGTHARGGAAPGVSPLW